MKLKNYPPTSLSESKAPYLVLLLVFLVLQQTLQAQQYVTREFIRPVRGALINFKQLSKLEALQPRPVLPVAGKLPNEHEEEYQEPYSPVSPPPAENIILNRTTVTSPSPVQTYEGAPDAAQFGSGTWTIPPDTYGAVGLDKVFVQLNNNYRILDKSTGSQLSIVSIETFWSSLGTDGSSVFDPRIVYDPYNNRWIVAAVSHGGSASSRILLAISQTHDPEGNFSLFSFDPDTGSTLWADFPMLGFNTNWIAIGVNMFTIPGVFSTGKLLVVDYPSLRGGSSIATLFSGTNFCTHPAETYSSSVTTLYAPAHLSSAGATYQLNTITGTPGSPVFTSGGTMTRTGGGWSIIGAANAGPQNCTSSCPGTLQKLELPDAQLRNNVVFRNNAIWYTQTVGLPAGGSYTRSVAQWTKINTDGTFADGGRVDDPTATSTNGGRWYSYGSICVNSSNDALMGFSKMESDGFAGGAYTLRLSTDAAGSMQDPVVYQDGLDYYEKDFGGGRYRWGDYSHTVIDPLDDASFWTIQEYAKLRAAPTVGGSDSKWGTWWAKVAPNPCLANAGSGNWNTAGTWGCGGVPDATKHVTILSGSNVTLDVDPLAASITVNSGGTLTISTSRTLSCKLIVYGTINITGGKLTLGTNDLFLSENATVTGASSTSYFVTNSTGKVSKIIPGGSSFEFPVSPNTSSYNSLTIANGGGNPDEVYSVRVSTGVSPSIPGSATCIQRTWNITEMTTGGNPSTLTFKWAVADQGGSFNNTATPYAFRHNGAAYTLMSSMSVPSLSSGIYSSTTSSTVSTFSPWIVSSSSTLPVVLDYFTGSRLSNGTHKLDWKASCSGNYAYFELQRSSDGRNFNPIHSVTADFASCLAPYGYIDNNPLPGKNFYRLKLKDEAGKITYSPTLLLLNSISGFEVTGFVPNPVNDKATLMITLASRQDISLIITDSKGSRVFQKNMTAAGGMNTEELDLQRLASGTYVLRILSSNGDQRMIRFVKQ